MASAGSTIGHDARAPEALERILAGIAERIARLRQQAGKITEQDTKRVLITPAIEALGWDIYDTEEVRNEYRHKSADNPVDYALFLNRSPVLFVEAKPLGHSLDDRKWVIQTINYANAAGVDWCVLTNGAEYRIYKVHAQVEADQKLFARVALDDVAGLPTAVGILGMLHREKMRARAIDELWEAWFVDEQVKAALERVLQDEPFIGLVRKQVPHIAKGDVRRSLQRASISVRYPDLVEKVDEPVSTPVLVRHGVSDPATEYRAHIAGTTASAPSVASSSAVSSGGRRRFQSIQDLLDLGRLRVGETLTIRGRENSEAVVVDGRFVDHRGRRMTYQDWGKQVTGWKAIQIYTQALTDGGQTLDQLRDEPQTVAPKKASPP